MAILILIAVASAVYFYFQLQSKDSDKAHVKNFWLNLPKDFDISAYQNFRPGYHMLDFWKPIGKSELHAFVIIPGNQLAYLMKVPVHTTADLFEAMDRGSSNRGSIQDVSTKGRLYVYHDTGSGSRYTKTFFGFYKKVGIERIERDFKKDFNLDVHIGKDGKEFYNTGVIPKRPEEIREEKQFEDWHNRLETWWQKKTKGETNEDFEGLLEENLNIHHHSLYRLVTGETIARTNALIRGKKANK